MAKIALRDYQEAAFGEIRIAFRVGEFPVLFVLPTGGGKTYTFSAIAASAAEKGNRVCIIVHRKELLLQASQSLTDLGIEHGLISPFFTPDRHRRVQVASVDTLLIRLKKTPNLFKFDLLIFDEAHHVVDGNKWGRAYEQLNKPKMLGVTATPVRSDGKGLGAHAGGVFKKMVLGPSVAELIRRGNLVNPDIYVSPFVEDYSDVKTNREGDYNLQEIAVKVDKPKITGDTVEQYTRICPGARTVAFCSSIQHAKHVVDAMNAAGYRFALLVGAPEMSDDERTRVNKALRKSELDGVCTVDLVSEGFDLPALECCIMLRPTASESLFLQQVGRIMRPFDGKRGCWLLDQVGNVGMLLEDGDFKRKHGFPAEEREWTLDGRKKKKRKKDAPDDVVISMKQCPKCFVVHTPAPACPKCGYVYPAGKKPPEQVDGNLHRISEEQQQAAIEDKRRAAVLAQASARTVEQMVNELGYSRKRAEAIIAHRQQKEADYDAFQAELIAWRTETGQQPMQSIGMYIADMRKLKPKPLRELREAFDRYRGAWRLALSRGEDPELAVSLNKILNPAAQPQNERLI